MEKAGAHSYPKAGSVPWHLLCCRDRGHRVLSCPAPRDGGAQHPPHREPAITPRPSLMWVVGTEGPGQATEGSFKRNKSLFLVCTKLL